jgi:GDP-L-fucose synthase
MPTNLYGPNDNFDLETSHVLPALIRKFVEGQRTNSPKVVLWGTGNPLREFLHVDDLAKAILTCLESYDSPEHINIGSGSEISIKDLADKISNASNFEGEIVWDSSKPDGTPRKVLDISKIKKLGWTPKISLDEGISQTVQWYQENK